MTRDEYIAAVCETDRRGAVWAEAMMIHDAEQRQEIDRLKAEVERLRDLFAWLLGEQGEFPDEPELLGRYKKRFWWRSELRKRLETLTPKISIVQIAAFLVLVVMPIDSQARQVSRQANGKSANVQRGYVHPGASTTATPKQTAKNHKPRNGPVYGYHSDARGK